MSFSEGPLACPYPWWYEVCLIKRSERIVRRTFPTTGIRPHATGAVQRAALYASLPETVGRWGCVEGKRWREIEGERSSWGRGVARSLGRVSWRIWSAGRHVNLRFRWYGAVVVVVRRHTLSKF